MSFNRRTLIKVAAIGGVGTLAASQLKRPSQAAPSLLTQGGDRYGAQVDEGLKYYKKLAAEQLPLVEALLAAIQSGNLSKAQNAYVEARPPYEQIEVLAGSFEQTDSDIDARPYAFDNGEEDEEFRGFHKIEAFIYRDQDLASAIPYAKGLITSVKTLMNDLNQRQNFSAATHFEGMIALTTEVATKKISSEEETWSDQSLLIFRDNWDGVYSQFKPFKSIVMSKNPIAAAEVQAAYTAAQATIAQYFRPNRVAAEPYSSVGNQKRGQIVKASMAFRNALINAADVLQLG